MQKRFLTFRQPAGSVYNRFTSPYKYASAGGDGPMVYSANLDEQLTVDELSKYSSSIWQWMPSADGAPEGILVEWNSNMQMWCVWTMNNQ